jgi:hypothetical protein
MRKPAIAILIGAMSFVLAVPLNAAAPKAGTKCAKLGATSTLNGIKYTCIKSGKNLVWNKGVALPKPTPTPTPTSKPTPTPTLTPTIPKAPTSFDDLIQNYEGIAYSAWSKSREKILASSKANISLNLVIGPNTQLTFKEPQNAIDLVTRLYSGYASEAQIYFLAFNFNDRNWATEQMESILPNAGSGWISNTACKTKETCWGGGAFSNGMGKYLIVETMGNFDTNHTSGSLEAHEFTHIVQQMSFKKGRPAAQFTYDPWPPTWYWEGQAHFAQHAAVYHDSFSKYLYERSATAQDLYRDPAFNSEHIEKYFVFNAPADWQKNYDQWHQYDLGAMFVEILTALKGPDSTMEMWRLTGTGINFPVAFEQVYGVSFSKALPIMAKAIALELGRN